MFPFQGLPVATKTGVGVSGGGGLELWWNPGYCVWGSLSFHRACEVVTSLMSYGAMTGACLCDQGQCVSAAGSRTRCSRSTGGGRAGTERISSGPSPIAPVRRRGMMRLYWVLCFLLTAGQHRIVLCSCSALPHKLELVWSTSVRAVSHLTGLWSLYSLQQLQPAVLWDGCAAAAGGRADVPGVPVRQVHGGDSTGCGVLETGLGESS